MTFDLTESNTIPNDKHLGKIYEFNEIKTKAGNDALEIKVYLEDGPWAGKRHVIRVYNGETLCKLAVSMGIEKIKTPTGGYDKQYDPDPDDYLNEEIAFSTTTPDPTPDKPNPFTNYLFFPAEEFDGGGEDESTPKPVAPVATRRPATTRH